MRRSFASTSPFLQAELIFLRPGFRISSVLPSGNSSRLFAGTVLISLLWSCSGNSENSSRLPLQRSYLFTGFERFAGLHQRTSVRFEAPSTQLDNRTVVSSRTRPLLSQSAVSYFPINKSHIGRQMSHGFLSHTL